MSYDYSFSEKRFEVILHDPIILDGCFNVYHTRGGNIIGHHLVTDTPLMLIKKGKRYGWYEIRDDVCLMPRSLHRDIEALAKLI